MTTRAHLETRTAPLWEQFGLDYAARLFGQETLDSLPRYKRGPKTGKINAYLRWTRATSGGWYRECQSVLRPKELARAWICKGPFGLQSDALVGQWMGRPQTLCGSKSVLGEANRNAEMARQEACRQELTREEGERLAGLRQLAEALAELPHMTPTLEKVRAEIARLS